MNFLSHHFLQRKPGNDHFTAGVTFPDILTLHNAETIIHRNNFTNTAAKRSLKPAQAYFLKGMSEHMYSDKIFHSSRFFKESLKTIQQHAIQESMKPLPEILRHILLEILMDRYLILHHQGIAEDFYALYARFPFTSLFPLLHSFSNFTDEELIGFINRFIRNRFFLQYREISGALKGIKMVNSSMKTGYTFVQPDSSDFIDSLYNRLESSFQRFFTLLERKH